MNSRYQAARRHNKQTHLHRWCAVYAVYAMGKRSRHRSRAQDLDRPGLAKRDRMARVQVDDATWQEFRGIAGFQPISEILGELVEREVHNARSARLRDGRLEDREVVDALDKARELQADLAAIVARLESLR